jgi:hypothetical protein
MARLTVFLLMAALAAAVASGCGGGDDDSLSKEEFVEQAQAACKEQGIDLLAVSSEYAEQEAPGESASELRARIFEEVQLPAIEAELTAVRELGLPEDGAAEVEDFLAAEQKAIDAAAAASDGPSRSEMERRFDAAARLANDYGITNCAHPRNGLVGG